MNAGRRAVSLDPQNVDTHTTLGQVLAWARHYNEALTAFRAARVLRPNSIYISFNIANTLLASDQFEQARQLCETCIPPRRGGRHLLLAVVYHGLGRQRDAENEAAQYKALHRDEASLELAGVYAQLGNTAAALEQLAKAEQQRDPAFQVLRLAWEFDPIRNDPQFKAIEARMNFPP